MTKTSSGSGQHAGGGPASKQPVIPEPTYGERARTLAYLGRLGSLSTHSRKQPGWPFGSVMPYALDAGGCPIFLISSMAMHTQNIAGDARAGLLITQLDTESDPLGASRVTLLGNVLKVPDTERGSVREVYLARHKNAGYWVDFDDFAFYRMEVVDVYFVGGFGVMGWVSAEYYLGAEPDPLVDSAPGILRHVNADHADALLLMVRVFAAIETEEAAMTSVDRLGFQVRLKSGDRVHGTRIAFPREVRSPEQVRAAMVEMVGQARVKAPKSKGATPGKAEESTKTRE